MKIIQVKIPNYNYNSNVVTQKQGIVYHWTATSIAMDKLFQNTSGRKASAHYGIADDGTIYQYVPDNQLAYHANFVGDPRNNNRMYIGIEHYGGFLLPNGTRYKPSVACHNASIELTAYLAKKYGWKLARKRNAWRHQELAPKNQWTECCGTLDTDYIVNKAINILNKPVMPTLQDALTWNTAIRTKELTRDAIQLIPGGNPSKLIDVVDNADKEWLITKLYELNGEIMKRPSLVNTTLLDETFKRYSAYLYKSLSI